MPSATARKPPAVTKSKSLKLDDEKVLAMAKAGVSIQDIAQHQGVADTTVWRFLKAHQGELQAIDIYKAHRADLYAGVQLKALDVQERILSTLTDGVLLAAKPTEKAMILNAVNNVFGTIFDKERLERGQSTANVSLIGKMMGGAFESAHKSTTNSGDHPQIAEAKSDT